MSLKCKALLDQINERFSIYLIKIKDERQRDKWNTNSFEWLHRCLDVINVYNTLVMRVLICDMLHAILYRPTYTYTLYLYLFCRFSFFYYYYRYIKNSPLFRYCMYMYIAQMIHTYVQPIIRLCLYLFCIRREERR